MSKFILVRVDDSITADDVIEVLLREWSNRGFGSYKIGDDEDIYHAVDFFQEDLGRIVRMLSMSTEDNAYDEEEE